MDIICSLQMMLILVDIIIYTYQSPMESDYKNSQQIEEFIKNIYLHIVGLPARNIEQAVIMVSSTIEVKYAFEKIIGQALEKSIPTFRRVENQFNLIYPTDSFLKPEHKSNFVTMHYLLKTVKRVKFLFVFGHQDANEQTKMINVKIALERLFALLKKSQKMSEQKMKELSQSCGILINDSQKDAAKYLPNLKKMGSETKYISDEDTKKFVQFLTIDNKKPFTIDKSIKTMTQEQVSKFTQFVNNLKYYQLEGFEYSRLHELNYEYDGYTKSNISLKWEKMLKFIIDKLDVMIAQSLKDRSDNQSDIEKQIKSKMQDIVIPKDQIADELEEDIPQRKSSRLIKFIRSYIDLIENKVKQVNDEGSLEHKRSILMTFIDILYKCGFLISGKIKFFFESYFMIYKFLHMQPEDDQIFQSISWKSIFTNRNLFNQKIRFAITTLLKVLSSELDEATQKYEFDDVVQELAQLIESLRLIEHSQQYNFLTVRIFKKIKKFKAEFAYKKASILSEQIEKEKETIEAWLQFLESSLETTLIKPKQVEEAINFIAGYLTDKQQYRLALKLYTTMPEHISYKKIRDIYQKGMNFYPQILKYTLLDNWYQQEQNFVSYCNFLLRMGKNEEVRQLCLEGIGVLKAQKYSDVMQQFRRLLVHARSENSRQLFNNMLDSEVMEQLQIKLENDLIKEVRDKIKQIS